MAGFTDPVYAQALRTGDEAAAAILVDGRRTLVELEDFAKAGVQAIYFQRQRRLRSA